ncbi:PREDICTED: uncharacterized protein LOC109487129 [Branchiostoma belcheri]|uniref:Uncharacterized protein LOC109487129 n=1 Tax=Branchiostoma belcheri TaxID=7741 RepID=A0A6P5AUA5_BRABE|nr:PREDICTED: uncharacterized protein LOC109487129 [Branchiostoma belcheri]
MKLGHRSQKSGGNCAPSPCLQGGRCQDLGYTYRCLCPRGCTGRRCQLGKPEPRGVYISIGGGKDGGGSSNSGKGAINVINNQISVYGGDTKPCCSKPPCACQASRPAPVPVPVPAPEPVPVEVPVEVPPAPAEPVVVATEVPKPVVVTTPVPKVETPAPVVVTTAAPKVETPAPVVVTTAVPKVETPAPVVVTTEKPVVVTTPVPKVETPAPVVVTTAAPKVETPAPVVVTTEKPVVVTTPVPKVETPAPVVVTTAEPIIVTTKLPPTQKPETPAPEPEPEAPPAVEKVEAESQQSSSSSQVETQQVQLDCAKWQTWYGDMKKKLPAAQFQSIMNSCKPNTCRDAAFKETYPDMFTAVGCAAYLLSIKSQVQSQTQQVQLDCAKWQTWYGDMKKKLPAAQFQSIMNSCKPNTCRDAAFKETYPDMFKAVGCAAYLLSIKSQVQSQTQQVQLDCAKWQTWYADMKKKLPAAQFQSIMNSCKPNTCRDAAFKETYPDMFTAVGCAAYLLSIKSQVQSQTQQVQLDCAKWQTWYADMKKKLPAAQFQSIMNSCKPNTCRDAAFKETYPDMFKAVDCAAYLLSIKSQVQSQTQQVQLDCAKWQTWYSDMKKKLPAAQFQSIMNSCKPNTCRDAAFKETYPDMFKAVDCAAYLLSIKSQVQSQTQQVQLDCAKWQTWYADMKKKLPAAQFQSIMTSCKPNTCRDAAFKETYPDMFKAVDCAAYLLSIQSQVQSQTQQVQLDCAKWQTWYADMKKKLPAAQFQSIMNSCKQVQLDCAKWQTWYADMKKKLPAAQFQSIMNSCKPNTCRDAAFKETYPDMFKAVDCAAYLLSIKSQVQSQTQQVQLDCAKWQTWYADMKKKLPAAQFQSIMNSCKPNTCRDAAFKTTYPDMFGTLGCAAYLLSIQSQVQSQTQQVQLDCAKWQTWYGDMKKKLPAAQFQSIMNSCKPNTCRDAAFKTTYPDMFGTLGCAAYLQSISSQTQTSSSSKTLDCGAWKTWIQSMRKHPQFGQIMNACRPQICKAAAFKTGKPKLFETYCKGFASKTQTTSKTTSKSSSQTLDCGAWASWIGQLTKHPQFDTIMKTCSPVTCKDPAFEANELHSKYCTSKRSEVEEEEEVENMTFDLDSLTNERELTEADVAEEKMSRVRELLRLLKSSLD